MPRNISLNLRSVLRWFGSGLALIGIAFITWRLYEHGGDLDLSPITSANWMLLIALTVLYGVDNLLLALSWWHVLLQLGGQVTRYWSIKTYSVSQLAKYVPGNIFHFAGRQAMGMAADVPGRLLINSTCWELGLVATAGTLNGWLVLPLLVPAFSSLISLMLFLSTGWLIAYLIRRIIGPQVATAFIYQTLFLAISGGIFVSVFAMITNSSALQIQTCLLIGSAYIVAWLVGIVTPGAPAGVGIREFILLWLLKGMVTDADLLITVLLGRLVTVVGDLLFFMVAFLIPQRRRTKGNRDE
ncbi:hypothetical protein [Candidatus Regiella insecticola]|uniref:Uncharacterized protein n=1 Tax=Candidatus Regiella insecticola TaxID=138073 RepID=A0A6L2ZN35_9ENTR|nr:hypothetical protein [Candidatus Regiella insecticola]GFN45661.1 uncharacterized protein RINTU1_09180 [Candidatus Regiella insecticola]